MIDILGLVAIGVIAFVATNIDDIYGQDENNRNPCTCRELVPPQAFYNSVF
jgi:hypothetical protein